MGTSGTELSKQLALSFIYQHHYLQRVKIRRKEVLFLSFISSMATFSKVWCKDPSQFFGILTVLSFDLTVL